MKQVPLIFKHTVQTQLRTSKQPFTLRAYRKESVPPVENVNRHNYSEDRRYIIMKCWKDPKNHISKPYIWVHIEIKCLKINSFVYVFIYKVFLTLTIFENHTIT